ncbi:unnamed protein product [Chrysoparadoxa australica]
MIPSHGVVVLACGLYIGLADAFLVPVLPSGLAPSGIYAPVQSRAPSRQAPLFSSTSFGDGVQLPPVEEVDDYAAFLAEAVQLHLDEEWLIQEVHRGIGEEVGSIYKETIKSGVNDLTSFVVEVGTALEQYDMGDAFVGSWDVANIASDFVIAKMGLEVSGCSTKLPEGLSAVWTQTQVGGAGAAVAPAHLLPETVNKLKVRLGGEFERYRFMADAIDEMIPWGDLNAVMHIYLGYREADGALLLDKVNETWATSFAAAPPDLETAQGVVELLESEFPTNPDELEGLEDFIVTLYGEELKKVAEEEANEDYVRRVTCVKWLYMNNFLREGLQEDEA